MNFTEYKELADTTIAYEDEGGWNGLTYAAMSLAGEAGEVSGKVSKIWRDCKGVLTDDHRKQLAGEAGDVLWHLNALCNEVGVTLEEVAIANIAKLKSRKERGKIQGSGDNR